MLLLTLLRCSPLVSSLACGGVWFGKKVGKRGELDIKGLPSPVVLSLPWIQDQHCCTNSTSLIRARNAGGPGIDEVALFVGTSKAVSGSPGRDSFKPTTRGRGFPETAAGKVVKEGGAEEGKGRGTSSVKRGGGGRQGEIRGRHQTGTSSRTAATATPSPMRSRSDQHLAAAPALRLATYSLVSDSDGLFLVNAIAI